MEVIAISGRPGTGISLTDAGGSHAYKLSGQLKNKETTARKIHKLQRYFFMIISFFGSEGYRQAPRRSYCLGVQRDKAHRLAGAFSR